MEQQIFGFFRSLSKARRLGDPKPVSQGNVKDETMVMSPSHTAVGEQYRNTSRWQMFRIENKQNAEVIVNLENQVPEKPSGRMYSWET